MIIHKNYMALRRKFEAIENYKSKEASEIVREMNVLTQKITLEYFIAVELGLELTEEKENHVREFIKHLQDVLTVFALQTKEMQSKVTISRIIFREAELFALKYRKRHNKKLSTLADDIYGKADDIIFGGDCRCFPTIDDRIINWGG